MENSGDLFDAGGHVTHTGRFRLAVAMAQRGFAPREIQRQTGWTLEEVQRALGVDVDRPVDTPYPGPSEPAAAPTETVPPPAPAAARRRRAPIRMMVAAAAGLFVAAGGAGAILVAVAAHGLQTKLATTRPAVVCRLGGQVVPCVPAGSEAATVPPTSPAPAASPTDPGPSTQAPADQGVPPAQTGQATQGPSAPPAAAPQPTPTPPAVQPPTAAPAPKAPVVTASTSLQPRYTTCRSAPTLFDPRRWECIGVDVPAKYTDTPYLLQARPVTPACPAPLSGQVSAPWSGSRIPLDVELDGPKGARMISAFLDTGAATTTVPASVLADIGLTPYSSGAIGGVVPGASTAVYLYHLPGGGLKVWNAGTPEVLTPAALDVVGVPDGTMSLIGPDVLRTGVNLSVDGSAWTLWPACQH